MQNNAIYFKYGRKWKKEHKWAKKQPKRWLAHLSIEWYRIQVA